MDDNQINPAPPQTPKEEASGVNSVLLIIVFILLAIIVAGGAYYYGTLQKSPAPTTPPIPIPTIIFHPPDTPLASPQPKADQPGAGTPTPTPKSTPLLKVNPNLLRSLQPISTP